MPGLASNARLIHTKFGDEPPSLESACSQWPDIRLGQKASPGKASPGKASPEEASQGKVSPRKLWAPLFSLYSLFLLFTPKVSVAHLPTSTASQMDVLGQPVVEMVWLFSGSVSVSRVNFLGIGKVVAQNGFNTAAGFSLGDFLVL